MVALLTALITISFPYIDIASKDPRFQFDDPHTTNDPNNPSGSSRSGGSGIK
jgi:hypothetical protein